MQVVIEKANWLGVLNSCVTTKGKAVKGHTITQEKELPEMGGIVEWMDTFCQDTLEMAASQGANMTPAMAKRLQDCCMINLITFEIGE